MMREIKKSFNYNFLLWQLLHRSFHALIKIRGKELYQHGLTIRQSAVLRTILELGIQASPSKLSKRLFLELNTISEQLKRMEAVGLITKVKDSNNKNPVRIEVTEKGYELHLKTEEHKSVEDILSVLTEEERTEFWSILSKIRGQAVKQLGISQADLYPPSDVSILYPLTKQPFDS